MTSLRRRALAGICGVAATLGLNALGLWWLRMTIFQTDAFYDGSAAILTLAAPALLGGLLLGWIARDAALNVAVVTFAVFCVVGFIHPVWRIPLVTTQSAHSGGMHYFLYDPLVALAFGALGGWVGGQFATGRFSLADKEPVLPEEL